ASFIRAGKTPRPAPTSSRRGAARAAPKRRSANARTAATRPRLSERSAGGAVGRVDIGAVIDRRDVHRTTRKPMLAERAALVLAAIRADEREGDLAVRPLRI